MLRIAASNLIASGLPIDQITDLDLLLQPSNAKVVLRRLHERNGRKLTAFVRALATELIGIASRYPRVAGKQHLDALKDMRRKLGSLPNQLTKKNRTLLQRFEDEQLLSKLLDVPALLERDARRSTLSVHRRVQMIETAVAIEILLCAPLRLANLCMLELGRHLPKVINPAADIHLSL